ncbi:hypothetical protein T07_1640 [Trichinella nelsoni]|uniref:Uncharacterized protein n=1 Tax=Trichinella nelsoni TaxID=6336 RepID=A0A0V0S0H9_9BILA|nr:hypothetical protein T07_1640 [Trichinella nelsoni]
MKKRKLSDWIISCLSCQAMNLHYPGNYHLYSIEVHSPGRNACEQAHITRVSNGPVKPISVWANAAALTTRLDGKAAILGRFSLAVAHREAKQFRLPSSLGRVPSAPNIAVSELQRIGGPSVVFQSSTHPHPTSSTKGSSQLSRLVATSHLYRDNAWNSELKAPI